MSGHSKSYLFIFHIQSIMYFYQADVSKWCCNDALQIYIHNLILNVTKEDLQKCSLVGQQRQNQAQWVIKNRQVILIFSPALEGMRTLFVD